MLVSIAANPDTVVVTALAVDGAQVEQGELVTSISQDQSLGKYSFDDLRSLGDGTHELDLDPAHFILPPMERSKHTDDYEWWQYVMLGFGSFFLAAVSYGLLWSIEEFGGQMTVRRWMAWLYEWGGKDAVAGVFIAIGLVLELAGVVTFMRRSR